MVKKLLSLLFLSLLLVLDSSMTEPVHAYNVFMDKPFSTYADHIPAWLESWGNTVTVVANYKGEDLSAYDLVLDFDYDGYNALTSQERVAYTQFLNSGRGLYLAGERPLGTYYWRDISVLNYLTELGAGDITVDWRDAFTYYSNPYEQVLPSPVTQNTSLSVYIDPSLIITNPGNGFFIAHTNRIQDPHNNWVTYYGDFSNIIGFDIGQLTNAPNGRVVTFFDMTTMHDTFFPDCNQYIFKEIVTYLGNTRSLTLFDTPSEPIPEPATFVLLGAGCAVLFWHRLSRAGSGCRADS